MATDSSTSARSTPRSTSSSFFSENSLCRPCACQASPSASCSRVRVPDRARILLAWRKPRQQDISFATALVLVVILIETHNAGPPHLGWMAGDIAHHGDQFLTVLPPGLIHPLDEARGTDGDWSCSQPSGATQFARPPAPAPCRDHRRAAEAEAACHPRRGSSCSAVRVNVAIRCALSFSFAPSSGSIELS